MQHRAPTLAAKKQKGDDKCIKTVKVKRDKAVSRKKKQRAKRKTGKEKSDKEAAAKKWLLTLGRQYRRIGLA